MKISKKGTLASGGRTVKKIPVELSYQIIKHFSAGLYTSPNKAIEELVANSYDAWATNVHIVLPENIASQDAVVWVVDDGQSMDINGFEELWRIGESRKRSPDRESLDRPPIGKFGIGKLATYVLAKELTYICKRDQKCRAITMDFSKLEAQPGRKKMSLNIRDLTTEEAKMVLKPLLQWEDKSSVPIKLFGRDASKTWTIAAMGNLTDMAKKLTLGRLQLVLRTALPNNPQFNLYFNGKKLESEKIKKSPIGKWIIGKNDEVAKELDFNATVIKPNKPAVHIPQLGNIWGEIQLFEDSLSGDKAENWGRSHGYFVMVRGRLINLHDELFGLEALSHGAFSRFRMVVHADGLDEYLRATRESVSSDEEGVRNFRKYIKAKFNEARAKYITWMSEEEAEQSLSRRVSGTPRSLSRQPLLQAIRKSIQGEIDSLLLVKVPSELDAKSSVTLISELEDSINSENFFKEVRFEPLGIEQGLAIFDVSERCFKVNILHPFFANYSEYFHSPEPFQLLAITEVLTEAYLIEENLSIDQVRHIMTRRDRFLRELVFSTQLAAPLVAQLLDDNRSDPKGFENAIYEGMRSLGFEVSPLGGKGKPDGIALARTGIRKDVENSTYKITYDAKSTGSERISAKDIGAATIAQHREENDSDYSLVVAPGFEGDGDPNSNAVKQAIANDITLITLHDFSLLVLVAATRPLSYIRFRDEFFEKCRGPRDATVWIQKLLQEKPVETPLKAILEAIWDMMQDSPDPAKFAAVRERLALQNPKYRSITEQQIREWIESIRRLERDLITIEDDRVCLEMNPNRILQRVSHQTQGLPQALMKGSMYSALIGTKSSDFKDSKQKAKQKKERLSS